MIATSDCIVYLGLGFAISITLLIIVGFALSTSLSQCRRELDLAIHKSSDLNQEIRSMRNELSRCQDELRIIRERLARQDETIKALHELLQARSKG